MTSLSWCNYPYHSGL